MDTLTTGRVNAQQPSGEPLNEMLPLSSRLQRLAHPLLRMGFAAIMLTHGIPKMLGLLSCSNENLMCGLIGLIGNVLQLPAPGLLAMLVMLLETLGALMVAAGLKVRIVASLMVVHLCAAA
jgi:putative oxidoreductase